MLIQFNFKNFKSFRDETTLDLTATKTKEFSEQIVSIGGEKILPLATIYGANASGKSNVYRAFEYMSQYVIESFKYESDSENSEEVISQKFLFDTTSEKAESSFEVYFTVPGDKRERVYNYGFCLGEDVVTEEWLNDRAKTSRAFKTIFYRSGKTCDFSGISDLNKENIEIALEKQVLIVSLGAKLKVEKCKIVRDWFVSNKLADFGDVRLNCFLSRMVSPDFVRDETFREKVIDYFASFDEAIEGFEINKLPQDEDSKYDHYRINTLHKKIGSEEMAKIRLEEESAGTLKMFALFPVLEEVLQKGSILFADELNARLHPLLVRNVMLIFLNPEININHAQLIFTTHDTWQLSNHLLRRDEIWFTEKNDRGVSTLYSLADFVDSDGTHVRNDANYEKNYMIGRYGAIPKLNEIDQFGSEN